ncbi:MAG TPA: FHA domain-containing protein [Blastocatellia bacterium]|nr:FHA domain-containing protein [Blastocatellia bacterium]HMY73649.1 FHA domain-containing protein [Blastocatellia bacterium]HNG29514.1 FHA domain-containing protein [Blastocatellia bacterium]
MASDAITEQSAKVRHYRYPGELLSLMLTFLFLIGLFALAAFYFPSTWSATLKALTITLSGLAVYVVTVKLQQRAAFGTLVRVSARQFPELYDLATVAAERLSSPKVGVYVKRSSEMNIYTLGLWQRPIIVLTSSLVDQMEPGNLQFFIGREIGHIQAGHTWLRTLLKPLGSDVPVIGKLLNSVIFGDWINRAEFTADRAGLVACRSLTVAVSTMLKFGVGIRLFEKLDIREFLEQINEVRNVGGHLTEIVAEMPYLTQRIRALVRYALSEQYRALAPGRSGNTQILKNIPEAFVSARLDLKEIELSPSVKQQIADQALPQLAPQQDGLETVRTVIDDQVTIADLGETAFEDDNAVDPRLLLVAVTGAAQFNLRSRLTRIGRNHDNDIALNNDRVSRYHAEIIRDGDAVKVVDQQSRNGVWVNGRRIRESAELKPGDRLRIGKQEFTFVVKE